MKQLLLISTLLLLSITVYSQERTLEKKSAQKNLNIGVKYPEKSQIVTVTNPIYLKTIGTQIIKQSDGSQIAETPEIFRKKTGPILTPKPSDSTTETK